MIVWAQLNESGPGILFSSLSRILSDCGLKTVAITHGSGSALDNEDFARFQVVSVHNVLDYLRVCSALSKARRTVLIYQLTLYPPPFALPLRLLGRLPMVPVIIGSNWFDSVRLRLISGTALDRLKAHCYDNLYRLLMSGPSITASTKDVVTRLNRIYRVGLNHLAVIDAAAVGPSLFMSSPSHNTSADHPKGNTILFVGRLSEEKGVEILVKSMKRVAESVPETKLVIVGGGPLRAQLQTLVDTQGIGRHVQIVGPVPNRDVPNYMRAATVGVFPYIWGAGAGNAVFEAMSSGLPVIVSEINDTIVELSRKKCVLGVPPKDDIALAHAILILLSDMHLRKSYALNGRTFVEESLSPGVVAATWNTVIRRARERAR